MKTTIETNDTFDVTSRGVFATIDLAKVPQEAFADAALHGFKQKIADAASGASRSAAIAVLGDKASDEVIKQWMASDENIEAIQEETITQMESAIRNLYENGWTSSRGGSVADPLLPYLRKVIRKMLLAKGNEKAKAKYDKIPSDDQKLRIAFVDEIVAKHREAITPQAEEMLRVDNERKAAEKQALKGVSIEL